MTINEMSSHDEMHYTSRVSLLRAAVLGANDGIISTSSLIIGVAAAGATREQIITAATAGLIAGAMSMAAGEYVSVSSQADTENADIEREVKALRDFPEIELEELKNIYIERGLDEKLAGEVAVQLTEHDALGSHLRDEIGIIDVHKARPFMAALSSGLSFTVGSALSVLTIFLVTTEQLINVEIIFTLIILFSLGGLAARAGGSSFLKGAIRISLWGGLAMGFTSLIGSLF